MANPTRSYGGKFAKGETFSPQRLAIIALLTNDMKGGGTRSEVAEECEITKEHAGSALFCLVRDLGKLKSMRVKVPNHGGWALLYYAPENEKHALRRKQTLAQEIRDKNAARLKARKLEIDLMRPDAPPSDPAAVVPDRSKVWAQPVVLAGFGRIGEYLPGDSWAARAYG